MGREHQHPRQRQGCADSSGGLEPIDVRHVQVHQHQGRRKLGRGCDAADAVSRLAHHLEPVGHVHHQSGHVAKRGLVVDDEHGDGWDHSKKDPTATVAAER